MADVRVRWKGDTLVIDETELAAFIEAQSGTSGAGSWLQVLFSAGAVIPRNTNLFIPFDDNSDPLPRGAGLTWDIGTPTDVVVATTGDYDIAFFVDAASTAGGGSFSAYVVLNDDSVGPLYYWEVQTVLPDSTAQPDCRYNVAIPGVRLEVGDVLKLQVSVFNGPNPSDTSVVRAGLIVSTA